MLSYFKSQQPVTVLGVFFVFLLFKVPFFLMPSLVPVIPVQNIWFAGGVLLPGSIFLNILLAQLCLLVQAFWFNYLFHQADYHETRSMIPALYYIFVTSLIPEFNIFSVYTLTGFLLLSVFQTLLRINVKESAKLQCFNLGILGGLLLIINAHFILFVLFLFLMLFSLKPFRPDEYLMLIFGILFPVYIAFSVSYVADIPVAFNAVSLSDFNLFLFRQDRLNAITLILTGVFLLFSFVSLRGIMYSTGFKRRKNINMLIFYLLGMVLTILFCGNLDETVLSGFFIPVAIFLSLFMLRIRKKRLGEILNAIFVSVTFITNIVRLFE